MIYVGRNSNYHTKVPPEIGIMLEILNLLTSRGSQGVIVSAISRTANVSFNPVNGKCQKLVDGGLVIWVRDGNKCRYAIAEKGIEARLEESRHG